MNDKVLDLPSIDIAEAIGMSHDEFAKLEARWKLYYFHMVHYGEITNPFVGKMF